MSPSIKNRLTRTALFSAIAVVIGAGIGFYQVKHETAQIADKGSSPAGTVPGTQVGGAFSLTDQNGRAVTEKDFEGYKLIYFGFTYCPAICPTELQKISQAMNGLGDEGKTIQPLFITIDPGRDTVPVMKDYVAMFHPQLTGLTGTQAQIDETLKNYRVYAKKVQSEEMADYTMDHSSFIYLMSPENELVSVYRTEDTSGFIINDIKEKLSSS